MENSFRILSITEKIKLICILYVSIWVSAPILAYGTIFRILALISIVIWIILDLLDSDGAMRNPNLHIFALYVFLLYSFTINYIVDDIDGIKRNIQLYILLFFILVYTSYQRKSLEILKPVIYINVVLFLIWAIATLTALNVNSHAVRYLIRSSEISRHYSSLGVGGFAFIYSLLIYITILIYLLKKQLNLNLISFFYIISLFLSVATVLKSGYTLAVILLVISMVTILFYSSNIWKNIIYFTFVAIILYILNYYILDILHYLLKFAEGTNYRLKINDIINSYELGEASGTAHDRLERYARSLSIFLENPLLGIGSVATVGKHSLILDSFAQYGIVIGTLIIYILIYIPYHIFITVKNNKPLAFTILLLIISLTLVNNVTMMYGLMFYIFYPFFIRRLEYEK